MKKQSKLLGLLIILGLFSTGNPGTLDFKPPQQKIPRVIENTEKSDKKEESKERKKSHRNKEKREFIEILKKLLNPQK